MCLDMQHQTLAQLQKADTCPSTQMSLKPSLQHQCWTRMSFQRMSFWSLEHIQFLDESSASSDTDWEQYAAGRNEQPEVVECSDTEDIGALFLEQERVRNRIGGRMSEGDRILNNITSSSIVVRVATVPKRLPSTRFVPTLSPLFLVATSSWCWCNCGDTSFGFDPGGNDVSLFGVSLSRSRH